MSNLRAVATKRDSMDIANETVPIPNRAIVFAS